MNKRLNRETVAVHWQTTGILKKKKSRRIQIFTKNVRKSKFTHYFHRFVSAFRLRTIYVSQRRWVKSVLRNVSGPSLCGFKLPCTVLLAPKEDPPLLLLLLHPILWPNTTLITHTRLLYQWKEWKGKEEIWLRHKRAYTVHEFTAVKGFSRWRTGHKQFLV